MKTPQGRLLHEAWRHREAFRSPSSPEEDPPKTNSVEKGYEPDCQIYVSVIVPGDKAGYICQSTLVHLQLGGGQAPLAKVSSLVWKPSFPNLQRRSFSFLGERGF